MYYKLLSFLVFLIGFYSLKAANFSYNPLKLSQADGSEIHVFISGDEYYQWIHDSLGYTLLQADDGFYYYAVPDGESVKPGIYRYPLLTPEIYGIRKWVKISAGEYKRRKAGFEKDASLEIDSPHSGLINNIVIFIRFADDAEFTATRQSFEQRFNTLPGPSLRSYYSEVSYNNYTISSTTYPECQSNTNLSYQDAHPRGYFQPYNAATNPLGYPDDQSRVVREHTLLRDAVQWINIHSPIPETLVTDTDNDGFVDNVCFIVKGSNGGWSSILWSHSWTLYSFDIMINGKYVFYYTFHPEMQSDVTTLCHEMFHTLGAPDLYHYVNSGLQPLYAWDLMDSGSGHMTAYMKWHYGAQQWIEELPEITFSGVYTLNPLNNPNSNCFKVKSPYSATQYFVLEYRKKEGLYESNLPGDGLLVYRVDDFVNGNSEGPPDEVYLFRPNGSSASNGNPESAFLSAQSGRTAINDTTNPIIFLQDGNPGGIMISEVSAAGSQISFRVSLSNTPVASGFIAQPAGVSDIELNWIKNGFGNDVLIAFSTEPITGNPCMGVNYLAGMMVPGGGEVIYSGSDVGFLHTGLTQNTHYYYKLWSVQPGNYYSTAIIDDCFTNCSPGFAPYYQSFDLLSLPNCWDTQESSYDDENWRISISSHAGGSPYELMCIPENTNGYTRLVINPFNTSGVTKLKLAFRFLFLAHFQGTTFRVQTSNNLQDWVNADWSYHPSPGGTQLPQNIELFLTENLDNPLTYIAFLVEGELFSFSGIYLDDLELTIEESDFFVVQTAAFPIEGGTVSGSGYYYPGQSVTLHAEASQGYNFLQWEESGVFVSQLPDYNFIAETDRNLTARFSTTQVSILTLPEPETGGIVTGGGIYNKYAPVDLAAYPAEEYEFAHWKEGGNIITTDEQYSFSAYISRTLTAVFTPKMFNINCMATPDVGGVVLGTGSFLLNQEVSLLAQANEGFIFDGWYENNQWVSSTSTLSFVVEYDRFLEARFHCPACNVILEAEPSQSGEVMGSGYYASGTSAEVQALPNEGWSFLHWTENGNVLSTQPEYSFVVDRNRTMIARFVKVHQIHAVINPADAGMVTGEGDYSDGTPVELLAIPALEYEFLAWTEGDDTLTHQPLFVFMASGDRNLTACFQRIISIPGDQPVEELSIYPNPCRDQLFIAIRGSMQSERFSFSLTNSSGILIFNQSLSSGITEQVMDLGSIPNGFYLARLQDQNGTMHCYKLSIVK